jgi:kynurenine 3-monooxygenase
MSQSTNTTTVNGGVAPAPATKNVVVVGAGPAGLLATLQFLERNAKRSGNVQYKVTLVDASSNYGVLSDEDMRAHHRSWMIGLASHGLNAIRKSGVPDLYDKYVSKVGIKLKCANIFLGSKQIFNEVEQTEEKGEGYIVDRNFIVASLARCLTEQYGDSPLLDMKYDTKVLFVDAEQRRVLVRSEEAEEYVPYDLLIGCDGFRSAVRECLVRTHKEFECHVSDIFQYFKATHIRRPKAIADQTMVLLPNCLPYMQGIALPEQGGLINLSMGVPRNNFDKMPDGIKSDDPKVVAEYMRQNFKAFELEDYDEFAREWIKMKRWARTGQVHCNTYHSAEHSIVIMGDAAHATSPSIGMGMNTALADVSVFHQLLDAHKDDLAKVLPAFSDERVKEGNALTDLAMHLFCLDPTAQLLETVHMVVRPMLHKIFPWLISKHPQEMIGLTRYKLSDVHRHATNLGIIPKHRYLNDKGRRQLFEKQCGLTPPDADKSSLFKMTVIGAVVVAVGALVVAQFQK